MHPNLFSEIITHCILFCIVINLMHPFLLRTLATRGILYLAHEQKVLVQSAQCSCVRTRASKTQGVVDARLEDKPELQLPHSSVMTE